MSSEFYAGRSRSALPLDVAGLILQEEEHFKINRHKVRWQNLARSDSKDSQGRNYCPFSCNGIFGALRDCHIRFIISCENKYFAALYQLRSTMIVCGSVMPLRLLCASR